MEPSCVSALTDDYSWLLPGDPRVALVARRTTTFEEFVAGGVASGSLGLDFATRSRRALLHGHCHQKSLVGPTPAHRTLQLVPGLEVAEIDSGCCGMAGAFGY